VRVPHRASVTGTAGLPARFGCAPTADEQASRRCPLLAADGPTERGCNTECDRCYTWDMPTARRRHAITETDEIAAALAMARDVWPDLADKPGALLLRLILTGRNSLVHDFAATDKARRQAIDATSGALAGVFGPSYLADLREDWPE